MASSLMTLELTFGSGGEVTSLVFTIGIDAWFGTTLNEHVALVRLFASVPAHDMSSQCSTGRKGLSTTWFGANKGSQVEMNGIHMLLHALPRTKSFFAAMFWAGKAF